MTALERWRTQGWPAVVEEANRGARLARCGDRWTVCRDCASGPKGAAPREAGCQLVVGPETTMPSGFRPWPCS